jgi:hypothetical protein
MRLCRVDGAIPKQARLGLQIALLELQNADVVPQACEFVHELRDGPEPNQKTLDLPATRRSKAGNCLAWHRNLCSAAHQMPGFTPK